MAAATLNTKYGKPEEEIPSDTSIEASLVYKHTYIYPK